MSPTDPPMPDLPLLRPREAAKLLGVTEAALERWRHTGAYTIPYVKVGRCVRYRRQDIEAFILRSLVDG